MILATVTDATDCFCFFKTYYCGYFSAFYFMYAKNPFLPLGDLKRLSVEKYSIIEEIRGKWLLTAL